MAQAAAATFPGANGKIASVGNQSGNAEIYTMDPDGGNRVNVTNDPAGDSYPNWSPDGTKIAFVRSNRVWAMNADGSGQTALMAEDDYPPGGVSAPAWSSDGT